MMKKRQVKQVVNMQNTAGHPGLLLCLVMALSLIPTVAFGDKGGSTPKLSPISITVTKEWDDDNNSLNKRPDSVTVKLLKDGEETGKTLTLYKDNWTGSFTDVPADGVYTVSEEPVDGYMPVYTQQPVITPLSVSGWSEKITPAKNPSYPIPVGHNLIVANKGNNYYVWTLKELTNAQENDLRLAVNAAKLSGLGKDLDANNTFFQFGSSAKFDNETTIENDTITFKNTKDWSLFYCGTVTPSSVTGAIITNTYKENVSTTGSLTIKKELSGVTADADLTFTFNVMQGEEVKETVSVEVKAGATTGSAVVSLPVGSYTVEENDQVPAPAGYKLSNTVYDYGKIATGANATSANVTENGATVTVTNTYTQIFGDPVYNLATLTIKKVDANNHDLTLSGAKFTLTNANGQLVGEEKVTGKDGICTFTGLTEGIYTLEETKAPENYQLGSIRTWTFIVTSVSGYDLNEDKTAYIETITYLIEEKEGASLDKLNTFEKEIPNTKKPEPVTVEIPVTKNVTISKGSKEPAETLFTFDAYVGNQRVGTLTLIPKSADKWTATDKLKVSISYELFKEGVATVTIKEVKGTDTRWKYDKNFYTVDVTLTDDGEIWYSAPMLNGEGDPLNGGITFENTYSYKYTPAPKPVTPTTVTSVKTGDMGVALYAGLAILSMTGSAGVILRRRKNDK